MTVASICPTTAAADLVLVEDGFSRVPIIVYAEAPPRTRQAAEELARYIEKVSGAQMEVKVGEPKPLPPRAIWVGFQPKLVEVFPKIDFKFQHPEEILIAANDNHLVIAGRDRWDPARLEVEGRNSTIKGKQEEYGTANAVYTFLQEYLKVRWLWPGAAGEDVIRQKTIAFAPFEYRYHPKLQARSGLFRLSRLGDNRGQSHDWVRFQRIQLDSMDLEGGHGFLDWWDRYHKDHPDYFALQPDGSRKSFITKPETAKLCSANPAVWNQWLANVDADLKNSPHIKLLKAQPNDSYLTCHCVCEQCRSWDDQRGELFKYHWKGQVKEDVALSDRHVRFYNELARKLKERFPDRDDLFVQGLAYGTWRPVPLSTVPDKNVVIMACFNTFFKGDDYRNKSIEQLKGWGKIATVIYRPNLWQQWGRIGLPEINLKQTQENFALLGQIRCQGVFLDTTWEHWATHGPQYYLMAQLTWNPGQDGRAVLDDYYRRGFGPAAAEIEAYWSGWEKPLNIIAAQAKSPEKPYDGLDLNKVRRQIYSDDFLAQQEQWLRRAADKVADAPEIYRQRVAFVRAGLEFTRLMFDCLILEQRVARSKGKDAEAARQAKALLVRLEQLNREHPRAWSFTTVRNGVSRAVGNANKGLADE